MARSDTWTPLRAPELGNLQLARQLRLLIEAAEACLDTFGITHDAACQSLLDRIETAKGYLAC